MAKSPPIHYILIFAACAARHVTPSESVFMSTTLPTGTLQNRNRYPSVDIIRGLAIVLMALDHARDFWSPTGFAPEDLSQALDYLEADHQFLLDGGVFTKKFLSDYIAVKRDEVSDERKRPTPGEFFKYYDV